LLATAAVAATVGTKPASRPSDPATETTETIRADVEWPTPKRYAIVLDDLALILTLHTTKGTLFFDTDQERSYSILTVEAEALVLRENRTGQRVRWRVGTTIPELPHRRLVGTALLTQIRYQSKPVEQISRPDPVLLAIDGSLAILEQQVLKGRPASAATTSRAADTDSRTRHEVPVFLKAVRIHAVTPDTYEIQGPALRASLENVGQLLSDIKLMVSPRLTAEAGLDFHVSSALADGVLDGGGFTITNNKVAEMFGIEVGDTIVRLNGQPVTSPLNAWWAYQETLIKNPNQAEMHLDLRRGNFAVRKVYRIK
jgi:hypothetical protein